MKSFRPTLLALLAVAAGCNEKDVAPATEPAAQTAAVTPTAPPIDDFLGLRIGQPLSLVECARENKRRYVYWVEQPVLPCWAHPIGMDGIMSRADAPDPRMYFTIMFGLRNVPSGFKPEGRGNILDGSLGSVEISRLFATKYPDFDRRMLTDKYGSPGIDAGSVARWSLPLIVVTHFSDVGDGLVRASSPSYQSNEDQRHRQGF